MQLPPITPARPLVPAPATPDTAEVARRFEALIVEQMLRSVRAGKLGDDGLGDDAGAERTREMTDRLTAGAIAARAPFGLAKVIR